MAETAKMRRLSRTTLTLLLLTLPVLSLSTQPGDQNSERGGGWKVERQVGPFPVKGSSSGQFGMLFLSNGQQRQIQLVVKGATGQFNFEASRSDGQRVTLARFNCPRDEVKVLTPSDPNFANLYGGYWDYFNVVRDRQRVRPEPGPQPRGPAQDDPNLDDLPYLDDDTDEPSGRGGAPPSEIFDPNAPPL